MTLAEFFNTIYPLLLSRTVERVEKELVEGKVTAYWAGAIIRIDIKPK